MDFALSPLERQRGSVRRDPAMFGCQYEREDLDRYCTEYWVTEALLRQLPDMPKLVWEPCAGLGHMAKVIADSGRLVMAADIDPPDRDGPDTVFSGVIGADFLMADWPPRVMPGQPLAIVTNPPFSDSVAMARHALALLDASNRPSWMLCFLMRSEWAHAGTDRTDITDRIALKIELTTRPRWDRWWDTDVKAAPRHNYAWFVWRSGENGPAQYRIDRTRRPKTQPLLEAR